MPWIRRAQHKALSRTLEDGSQVHSFCTLLKLLSGIVKNICRIPAAGPDAPTFEVLTTPNPKQQSALDLLKAAQHKALSRTLEDGSQVHSFCTLLKLLSGIVKNICRIPAAGPDPSLAPA